MKRFHATLIAGVALVLAGPAFAQNNTATGNDPSTLSGAGAGPNPVGGPVVAPSGPGRDQYMHDDQRAKARGEKQAIPQGSAAGDPSPQGNSARVDRTDMHERPDGSVARRAPAGHGTTAPGGGSNPNN
jgi:hypothetical protein